MRNQFLAGLGILLTLPFLESCKKQEADANPTNPNNPAATTAQQLAGDPTLNRALLTSKNEQIVEVDPGTGAHQVVFSFDRYADVSSLDYANGTVFAGAGDNSVNAVELQSKQLLWDVPLLRYETSALADPDVVVKDGVCYAVGIPGVLAAVEVTGKKVQWLYPLDPSGDLEGYYSQVGQPTVTADQVILGTTRTVLLEGESNYLHVIDKATGKRIWRKALPEGSWLTGTLKLMGNTLLVPARNLLALDIRTGEVLWEFKMHESSRGAGSPSIAGDRVLVQGASAIAEGKLFCLRLSSGEKLWELDAGNDYAGRYAPLVVKGAVVGVYERGNSITAAGNGRPFVADVATGKLLWENDDLSVETSPVFANGRLFFHGQNFKGTGSTDDRVGLMSVDATSGEFLWLNNYFRYSAATTPLVVSDNGIFRSGAYPE